MKRGLELSALALAAPIALLGLLIVATWAPDRPVSELQARWAPPPSVFVEVEGIDVHLRDEGPREDSSPIVLLHGTSSSLHTWEGWARALASERRVIRFDLPGFGLTGPFPDADYTIARYVRFVGAMLDALGVQRCVLAGNSFGGQLAWETALAHAQRIEKLILVDAVGYPLHAESVPIGFVIAHTPLLNRLMDYTLPRRIVEASVHEVYGDPSKVTPALVDRYFELTLRTGNRRALSQRMAHAEPDPDTTRITRIRTPTLILWGERDRLLPPDDAERFHRDIAGSRLVIFDDLGHVPHEEDPERTVAIAREFIGT